MFTLSKVPKGNVPSPLSTVRYKPVQYRTYLPVPTHLPVAQQLQCLAPPYVQGPGGLTRNALGCQNRGWSACWDRLN